MKKRNLIYVLTLAALTFSSCGNKTNNQNGDVQADSDSVAVQAIPAEAEGLKPATTKITGELGFCFDVVDQSYSLTENDGTTAMLTVKVKRNANSIPFNAELADTYDSSEEGGYIAVSFGIQITDKDGTIVDETVAGGEGHDAPEYPEDALALLKLKKDEVGTLQFVIHDPSKVNNECKFTVTSVFQER